MDPSPGDMPQFELPLPPGGQPAGPGNAKRDRASGQPMRRPAGAGRAAGPSAQPAGASASHPSANPLLQRDDNSTTRDTKKPLLEDTDLIEKEWVSKAKRIVENTRNDPRQQSEQLTVLKADYMKQHYGKSIKLK